MNFGGRHRTYQARSEQEANVIEVLLWAIAVMACLGMILWIGDKLIAVLTRRDA
mgnify:CR=1 FL=1